MCVAKVALTEDNVKENKSGLTASSGYPAFQKGAPPGSRNSAQGQHQSASGDLSA